MRISALIKFFVASLAIFLFFIATPASFAQGNTIQTPPAYPSSNVNPNVPKNLHNWTQTVMIETVSSATCMLTGIDAFNRDQPCLGVNSENGKIGFLPKESSEKQGGTVGQMGGMIASLFSIPVHTGDSVKDLAQNFGIVKKAHAQDAGTGFETLTHLLPIWRTFRNIAYTFLVVIFVVVGLAIMLRVRIDPRTVMTIQNQLPKLVVGILLITFSYAISGLLIDVMYVSIFTAGNAITAASDSAPTVTADITDSGNPFEAVGAAIKGEGESDNWGLLWIVGKSATSVGAIATDFIAPFVSGILTGGLSEMVNGASTGPNGTSMALSPENPNLLALWLYDATVGKVTSFVGDLAGGVVDLTTGAVNFVMDPLGSLVGVVEDGILSLVNAMVSGLIKFFIDAILFIIMAIILLIALFRLWFTLLFSYVKILIYVVIAPLWIMAGMLPGSPLTFGTWLRSMLANLASFPITIIMLLFAKLFFDMFGKAAPEATYFVPPLIGDRAVPETLGPIIAFGIILIIPNVISALHKSMKAPGMGFAVGAMIGAGTGAVTGGVKGGAATYATSKYDISGRADSAGSTGRVIQHWLR